MCSTSPENSRWRPPIAVYVDDGTVFGVEKSEPKPGGGTSVNTSTCAPLFGLQELSGLGEVATKRARPEWRGRTIYLGGLPKMTNQRGAYGYGCGQSVNPGGTVGVTCP